jgi:hypothetical protein
MIVLTIDEATPSLNPLLGRHWAHKHKTRARWAWLVKAARLNAKVYDQPKYPKARLTIERYGPRVLDADNARGGMKWLTDQLVQQGLLLDDKPEVIGEPEIRQFVSKIERTVVRIEGLPECSTLGTGPLEPEKNL